MVQIFHPSLNTAAPVALVGAPLAAFGVLFLLGWWHRSDYWNRVHVAHEQPVPFSHEHHVGGLGLDCRYCHWPVEESSFAGIPPTEVCMHCHSRIWRDSPTLEPVRASYRTGVPLPWRRVHSVPAFTYFDHSVHVEAGVACITCHGRVDRMPLTEKVVALHMAWCLDCHDDPRPYLRPPEAVFAMDWQPPQDGSPLRGKVAKRASRFDHLTDCSICHR